jgi:hypothetical protein
LGEANIVDERSERGSVPPRRNPAGSVHWNEIVVVVAAAVYRKTDCQIRSWKDGFHHVA